MFSYETSWLSSCDINLLLVFEVAVGFLLTFPLSTRDFRSYRTGLCETSSFDVRRTVQLWHRVTTCVCYWDFLMMNVYNESIQSTYYGDFFKSHCWSLKSHMRLRMFYCEYIVNPIIVWLYFEWIERQFRVAQQWLPRPLGRGAGAPYAFEQTKYQFLQLRTSGVATCA